MDRRKHVLALENNLPRARESPDTPLAFRKKRKNSRGCPDDHILEPWTLTSMSRAAILCALVATSTTAAPTVNAPDEKGFSFGSGNVRCCLAAHRLRASPTSPHATPRPLFGLIPSEHRRWRERLHDIDQRLHRRVL